MSDERLSRHDKPKLGYREAAEHRTVTLVGWACLTCNRLFPDDGKANGLEIGGGHAEHLARWCCTRQTPCGREGCTELAESPWTRCPSHHAEADAARRAKAPREPWDGKSMLCVEPDHYFTEPGEVEDWFACGPTTFAEAIEEGLVVLCSPNRVRSFELSDHVIDGLPEDNDDLPDSPDLLAAVEALNKTIEALPPLSWSPTLTRWDGTTAGTP